MKGTTNFNILDPASDPADKPRERDDADLNAEDKAAEIKEFLLKLQTSICQNVESEEGEAHFIQDPWKHEAGGGGVSCVLSDGVVIEKAGVNFSHVRGEHLPPAATVKRPEIANAPFQALGVSVVIHPKNPYAPTSHFNVRCIMVQKQNHDMCWWFGGGFDLTPYYGFEEDCVHWHQMAKAACDPFGAELYPKFKSNADRYFYLPHRKEPRGIGGIFFDDLNQWEFDRCFEFMRSVSDHYVKAYQPIIARRKQIAYGERERNFQLYRRGRYVEFNLLYDRGTLFGLQSNGRTESILMSLPPQVAWSYNWKPEKNSAEAQLYEVFLQARDWV